MTSQERRKPSLADLLALTQALANEGVEYIVIGGAAMALHGYPRMTKDIDLLLPVDAENNARLRRALESIYSADKDALAALKPESMDKGFSTALEADICVDLLYVAASRSFEEFREHIQTVETNGVSVVTLDVDGMLMSKDTAREEDIPDRLKLGRLKNAQIDLEIKKWSSGHEDMSEIVSAINETSPGAASAKKRESVRKVAEEFARHDTRNLPKEKP